jgi:hypothetical protein
MALGQVGSRTEGDVYQGLFFWRQAAELLREGSKVQRVVLEHDPADGVDDVAVFYFKAIQKKRTETIVTFTSERITLFKDLQTWAGKKGAGTKTTNAQQRALHESFLPFVTRFASLRKQINEVQKLTIRVIDHAREEATELAKTITANFEELVG